jgi:ferredoxin-nitrite reductase
MEKQFEAKLEEKIEQQKQLYKTEIDAFEEVGQKFVQGAINSNEFKASSGGMGVYAQKGGKEFMIRLRVLSGVLDYKTLELIKDFANDYDLSSIHLTTREAIQLHNLQFDQVISIMRKSLDSDLFTRGGGGNYPRNVSLSPLSGVEKNEAFDVTNCAVLVNKYFVSRMNSYRLPRKFKVAFSNNENDTAKATIADLGFLAVNHDGKKYFKVFIGGSLGNQGDISVPFDELVPAKDIFYHVEACIQLLVEEGDFENKGKARMRFIVKRMGEVEFLNCYKKILGQIKAAKNLELEIVEEAEQKITSEEENQTIETGSTNLIAQKQKGLYTVIVHPKGGILSTQDLNQITEFIKNIEQAQMRLCMEESLYIRNLSLEQAKHLLELIKHFGQTTMLERSVSCIGVPTCQIGIGESQKLLNSILTYFENQGMKEDILPSIHISGCLNSCSRHQVSEIGFHCKKKQTPEREEEVYSLHIGGMTSELDTHLAKVYGDLYADTIPEYLYKLALAIRDKQVSFLKYIEQFEEEFENTLKKYLI